MSNKSQAQKVTVRSIARDVLAKMLMKDGAINRQQALAVIAKQANEQLDSSKAYEPKTVTGAYNIAKNELEANGQVEPFGRHAEVVANSVKKAPKQEQEPELPWAIVDKESREIVGYAESRRKAQAQKEAGQVVKKTADAM